MRGDVEHVVHLVRVTQVGDEADRLGVGDGVGEGLGKALVARELDDAHLAVLVGREVRLVVGQRLLHRLDHAVHVVGMGRVEVHLDRNALVHALLHLPARRQIGVEVEHGPVHRIAEAAAAVHGGLVLQVARGQRDLVRCGADGGTEVQPVGVVGDVGVGTCCFILQLRHAGRLTQPALAPLVAVIQLAARVVTE
ncbi:hypothetical protein D3C75_868220 [compost metagenome]